jgi:hypothetical protein
LCTYAHRHTQGEKKENGLDFHDVDYLGVIIGGKDIEIV